MKLPPQISELLVRLTSQHKNRVLLGIAGAVLVVDFLLIMTPQLWKMFSLNKEVTKLSADLKTARNDIGRIIQYRNEALRLNKSIGEINGKIKSTEEVPVILERISRIASSNGVKIDQMMPKQDKQKSLLKNNEAEYFVLPIHIEASMGYHNFGKFLNELEKEEVFLRLENFILSSRNNDTMNHRVQMELEAIISEKLNAK